MFYSVEAFQLQMESIIRHLHTTVRGLLYSNDQQVLGIVRAELMHCFAVMAQVGNLQPTDQTAQLTPDQAFRLLNVRLSRDSEVIVDYRQLEERLFGTRYYDPRPALQERATRAIQEAEDRQVLAMIDAAAAQMQAPVGIANVPAAGRLEPYTPTTPPATERSQDFIRFGDRNVPVREALRIINNTPPDNSVDPARTRFIPGLGTVTNCLGCGTIVAGGPTACVRCASHNARSDPWEETLRRASADRVWDEGQLRQAQEQTRLSLQRALGQQFVGSLLSEQQERIQRAIQEQLFVEMQRDMRVNIDSHLEGDRLSVSVERVEPQHGVSMSFTVENAPETLPPIGLKPARKIEP